MESIKLNLSLNKTSVLECGVCGEQFAVCGEKVPRLLLCGHSFCHDCLTRLPVQAGAVVCPMDRQLTDVGPSGVWGLKKNFALIELMERLQLGQTSTGGVFSCDMTPDNKLRRRNEDSSEELDQTPCDEDDKHTATLYCVVCCTNLCQECAEATHFTKTLRRHRLMSLEDKPLQPAMCPLHQTHALEFVCLEKSCCTNPVMCFLCKEHGKHKGHKHSLFELEARKAKSIVHETIDRSKEFLTQIAEYASKLDFAIRRVEGSTQLGTNPQGVPTQQQCSGTAESARICIHEYFTRLRENIATQEEVALNTLQVHVRNMLANMRLQQDKISSLQSHITAAAAHCNKVMNKNDISLLSACSEISALSKMVEEQECNFREQLAATDYFDPAIPVTFTKDNRVHIGPKLEIRVVTLGLDGAGKTTLLFKLKQDEFMQPIPTIGFNVETVDYRNLQFTVWDVGGKHKLRPLWKHYYHNTQAVIFVIDSCDADRFEEAHVELTKLMCEKDLRDAVLLVLANKQDLPGAVSCEELISRLNLHKLCCGRAWRAVPCDARSGSGLEDGLHWLSRQLVAAGVLEVV